ncbi:HNH endonuclease signature motif containing protein [Microbacterium ulmi]|uniref:DUF222 domain-containing protein n=1 Tax=Microbacterium ulmi TaxID=179095 RepID=A0A7Y2LZV0_9MICO|nr:HNH endonuclease signature motif containing protein [Microbacterium ulmi]NII68923.1 hypothetical protein [Microbacterium ulmi]NNH03906.1 DUF222 domain-containing protein [Microbacterium ulmi]
MSAHPASDPRAERVIDAFEAGRRSRAADDAAEIRLLAEAADAIAAPANPTAEQIRRAELDRRSLVAELATSTRVSEWTVTRLLTEAVDLCARFADGVDALARGGISRRHLDVIHDAGAPIVDDDARAEFLRLAIDRAAQLTPGRLAPVLRVIAEHFLERTIDDRHEDAAARGRIDLIDMADGMAGVMLVTPATLAHGIHDRLTQQARSVIAARETGETRGEGDARTMAQLMADIATDTLLTAGPDRCVAGDGLDAIRATVQVTIAVLTMAGASAEPCLLAGYGPIDPETARALAGGTTGWERVMTSPVTGSVLAVDRYRPGIPLNRFLVARDEHCRFPGCRMPVHRCDVDHTIDAAHGGATSHCNLAHLCRRHHVLKHVTAWTVEQVRPGVLVWTSPAGRTHTDRPESTVRFVLDDEVRRRRELMREPWLIRSEDPLGSGGAPPF